MLGFDYLFYNIALSTSHGGTLSLVDVIDFGKPRKYLVSGWLWVYEFLGLPREQQGWRFNLLDIGEDKDTMWSLSLI